MIHVHIIKRSHLRAGEVHALQSRILRPHGGQPSGQRDLPRVPQDCRRLDRGGFQHLADEASLGQ